MKAVVLVGGEGTRLRPLTFDLPKPMVPICGKPFMEYQIELMSRYGIKDVIFSLGYKSEVIENHFGNGAKWGMDFTYVVEESPLGTGGAIRNVKDFLDDEPFYVFNGDILSEFDLEEIARIHVEKKAAATLALTPVEDPTIYGVVELDSEGRIIKFTEKPKADEVRSNLINAGLYVLDPKILDRMEYGINYSIERQIFPAILEDNEPMYGCGYDGYWMDIGNPHKYITANKDVLEGKLGIKGGKIDGNYLAPDARISDDAILQKPLWIGNGVKIESGAEILGPAVIGDGCVIGSGAKIEHSLLWEGSSIGNNSKLECCIVGRKCRIGESVSIGKLAVIGSKKLIQSGITIEKEAKV